jgi:hypothetical protein
MLFAGLSEPGICGICGKHLWEEEKAHSSGSVDEFAIWSAKEMSSIAAANTDFAVPLVPGSLAKILAIKIAAQDNGSWAEKIAAAGCSKRSRYLWEGSVATPRPETLFRICFKLGLHPIDLLREALQQLDHRQGEKSPDEQSINAQDHPEDVASDPHCAPNTDVRSYLPQTPTIHKKPRRSGRKPSKRRRQIRAALRAAILKVPPPSLNKIAIALNMRSPTLLRALEPFLCRELSQARGACMKRRFVNTRKAIETALEAKANVSLEKICKMNGVSMSFARRHFPLLRDAYIAKYRAFKRAERQARAEALSSDVARIVEDLRCRDEYPSVGRVMAQKPGLRSAGWDQIQIAICRALEALKGESE